MSVRQKTPAELLLAAWPYLLFAVIVACIFPEVIFEGKTFLGDPDRWVIQMPLQLLATKTLAHHMLPFWDSYDFCGQFALGQANMSLFYPPNFLIMWLMPGHVMEATSIRLVVEAFLALSCFYLFFLKVFEDRALAAFAALTFCLSTGLVISYNVGHSPQYFSALVLLAIWDWRERGLRRSILMLAGALFLHMSGGYLQHTTYVIAIAFLISLFRELRRPDWKSGLPKLALLWGVSMTAAFMLDSMELVAMTHAHHLSNRVATSYRDYLATWGVPWTASLRLLFPRFLGDYHDFMTNGVGSFYLTFNHDEAFPAYAGLAALFFSLIAALRATDEDVLPWLVMAVFLSLASLNTPVAAVPFAVYQKAPLIHGRLARLVPLALAFLAPAGIRSFASGTQASRWKAFALVLAVVLAAWFLARGGALAHFLAAREPILPPDLADRLRGASSVFLIGSAVFLALLAARIFGLLDEGAFKLAAVALLAVDLTYSTRVHTLPRVFVASEDWYPRSPVTDFLQGLPDKDGFNMEIITGTPWPMPAPLTDHGFAETIDGAYDSWPKPLISSFNPDINIPYALSNVNGYSNFINHWYSELVSRRREAFRGFRDPLTRSGQIADALGLKYVVTSAADQRFAGFLRPVFFGGGALVYARDNAVPRFHLACRAVTAPDDLESYLGIVDSGRVDFHRDVLVPAGTKFDNDWSQCRADANALLDLHETTPGLLEGRVSSAVPSLLVLAQSYDPGWQAFVDGRPALVQRANYAFQVVELPAGDSQLRLQFRPKHYGLALCATALAALFLVGLLLAPRFLA